MAKEQKQKRILPFIEHTKIWLSISLILVIIAVGALGVRGLNFGIDFAGGTTVTVNLHQAFKTEDIRSITKTFDKNADITYSGNAKQSAVISTKVSLNNLQQKKLLGDFQKRYSKVQQKDVSVDRITASVGRETTRNTILASLAAIALILVYVTIRFEFFFGLASVIALFHDIIVVIGVYALFQIQVNSPFIAAILTILGYSINDTIVVFDRIRENENEMGMANIAEMTKLVDASITQTLKRSINTVATTLVAIIALYIFAVDAIRNFAMPLIVGIACGCYSSIFVASPLWVIFQKHAKKSRFNTKQHKRTKRRRDRKVEKIEV